MLAPSTLLIGEDSYVLPVTFGSWPATYRRTRKTTIRGGGENESTMTTAFAPAVVRSASLVSGSLVLQWSVFGSVEMSDAPGRVAV